MLYIFHGTDIQHSREKAHKLIDSLRAKRPDASYEEINADSWNTSLIENHLGGQGLFSNRYIIFLDRVTENADAKDSLVEFVQSMNESPNIFIALEGKLSAELKKAFEKHAEKVVVSDVETKSRFANSAAGSGDFNIFALADAVGSRNAFASWSIYREAVDRGIESESILGTLFWQVKSIALARDTKSASAAGLSPFVYSKSKRYASNFTQGEICALLGRIITMYHDGHRGVVDIELSAERMLLSL